MAIILNDSTREYILITIDPGGTMGWAMFGLDERAFSRSEHKILRYLKFWDCGEFSGPEHGILKEAVSLVDYALDRVSYLRLDVVAEDFQLTQLVGSAENLLSPVRQNAVLSWECAKRGVHIKYQARQMRTSVTRERLKLFGFEGSFKKDEFAAVQHGVTWLRRVKQKSIGRPWKLSQGGILNSYWDCECNEGGKCSLVHPK